MNTEIKTVWWLSVSHSRRLSLAIRKRTVKGRFRFSCTSLNPQQWAIYRTRERSVMKWRCRLNEKMVLDSLIHNIWLTPIFRQLLSDTVWCEIRCRLWVYSRANIYSSDLYWSLQADHRRIYSCVYSQRSVWFIFEFIGKRWLNLYFSQ